MARAKDFLYGWRGRGVNYFRTIFNVYNVSKALVQSPYLMLLHYQLLSAVK
jgi:hypothetical protein